MKKTAILLAIPLSAVAVAAVVAVARYRSGTVSADRFSADLRNADAAGVQLAQSQTTAKYAFTETTPTSDRVKAPKATPSPKAEAPTPVAAPEPMIEVAALPETHVTMPTTQPDPAPAENPLPAVGRPSAHGPYPSGDDGTGAILSGGNRAGGGDGGWERPPIAISIIRGGAVDGDNCDPRHARPTGRNTAQPVYQGAPVTGAAGARGIPGTFGGTTVISGARPRRP